MNASARNHSYRDRPGRNSRDETRSSGAAFGGKDAVSHACAPAPLADSHPPGDLSATPGHPGPAPTRPPISDGGVPPFPGAPLFSIRPTPHQTGSKTAQGRAQERLGMASRALRCPVPESARERVLSVQSRRIYAG